MGSEATLRPPQRGQDRRAVGLEVAGERSVTEKVRAEQPERESVRDGGPDSSVPPNANPALVVVESADRRQAAMSRKPVPDLQMMRGGPSATALSGARSHRTASAGVRHASAASVSKLQSSIPSVPPSCSRAGQPCGRTILRASEGRSMCPPREKG